MEDMGLIQGGARGKDKIFIWENFSSLSFKLNFTLEFSGLMVFFSLG